MNKIIKLLILCSGFLLSNEYIWAMEKESAPVALFPIQDSRLNALELCPLFPQYSLIPAEIPGQVPLKLPVGVVKYHAKKTWSTKFIDEGIHEFLPCVKDAEFLQREGFEKILPLLKTRTLERRYIVQVKSVNQNEAMEAAAMCAGLSVRNSVIMNEFAQSGDEGELKQLFDLAGAVKFLNQSKCVRWLTSDEVNALVKGKINPANVSVIPTVFALDKNYESHLLMMTLSEEEQKVNYPQLRKKIADGLHQDSFFHTFIIGDAELVQLGKGQGHYFSFSIFKKNGVVAYVVADTLPESYHLDFDSYEYQRLLYLVELLETGAWTAKLRASQIINLETDTPYKNEK